LTPLDLLDHMAARGLPGAAAELPHVDMDLPYWRALLDTSRVERSVGFVLAAVESGELRVTDAQEAELVSHHQAAMAADLRLEQKVLAVASLFDEAGVPMRVLKGPAAAHLDYPDPSLRSFGDVDVLVPGSHFDAAVEALERCGHRRNFPEPRAGFDARFGKGAALVAPDGTEVDLHRSLAYGPFGIRVRTDDLWSSSEEFFIGGRVLHALSAPNRLLHACYHVALARRSRPPALRDVASLGSRPDVVEEALMVAPQWGATPLVAVGVAAAWARLHLEETELSRWAAGYRIKRSDASAIVAYRGASTSYAASAVAAIAAIPSWRDRMGYVRALVAPSASYLAGRHASRRARFRWALRALRSR